MRKFVEEELEEKYPGLTAYLEKTTRAIYTAVNLQEEMDEKFPVEGYEWDCDPNELYDQDRKNQFFLRPITVREGWEEKVNKELEKQLKCVNGEHHYIKITDTIEWCTFCGAIKCFNELKYPENPHFLPKSTDK